MYRLGLSNVFPEAHDKRERVYDQLREQERRIRAIDRMLAVADRQFDEGTPRVDA